MMPKAALSRSVDDVTPEWLTRSPKAAGVLTRSKSRRSGPSKSLEIEYDLVETDWQELQLQSVESHSLEACVRDYRRAKLLIPQRRAAQRASRASAVTTRWATPGYSTSGWSSVMRVDPGTLGALSSS